MIDIVLSLILIAALVYVVLYVTVFSKKEILEIYRPQKVTGEIEVILNGQNYKCEFDKNKSEKEVESTCYHILNPKDSFKLLKGPTNDMLIKVVNNKAKNFKEISRDNTSGTGVKIILEEIK